MEKVKYVVISKNEATQTQTVYVCEDVKDVSEHSINMINAIEVKSNKFNANEIIKFIVHIQEYFILDVLKEYTCTNPIIIAL